MMEQENHQENHQENQQYILSKMNDMYGEEYKNKLEDVLSKMNDVYGEEYKNKFEKALDTVLCMDYKDTKIIIDVVINLLYKSLNNIYEEKMLENFYRKISGNTFMIRRLDREIIELKERIDKLEN